MKERPILFSASMVKAILSGAKRQTRRVVKPPPACGCGYVMNGNGDKALHSALGDFVPVPVKATSADYRLPCPYGRAGDRLWVREAFRLCAEADSTSPRDTHAAYRLWYEADAPHQPGAGKLRPGMFMPRWASRILLEVTGVRVERLQEISRGDAMDEGCPFPNMADGPDPRQWYRELWEQINGAGSWDANPWVWVVEFRRT